MVGESVISALTKNVLDAAAAVGLDTAALKAGAGLKEEWLTDPDARVPLEHHARLWALISKHPVGLELGARMGVEALGVVGYAMQHGETVGEALAWQHRLRAIVHPAVVPHTELRDTPAGRRVVFIHVAPPPFIAMREPIAAFASATVETVRQFTGTPVQPAFVTLPLAQPQDPSRYEQFFQCPVAWGAPRLEVAFDASILEWPLPRSNAALFGYLAKRAEALLAQLPSTSSHADRVRVEIGGLLATGEPRLGQVARRLGMSERTLHRRLTDEGTGFAALVDEARLERARLLLADRSLSCSEIAFLLGYADPAVFFRAFKRWTGATPQAWRTGSVQEAGGRAQGSRDAV